jgi:sec-independent protein translocase protein TatA
MIGTAELIVILCVILLLFGGKKLPEIARNLGKGFREFKKACQGLEEQAMEEEKPAEMKEIQAKVETINSQEKP